jgi:rRNA small subunit pseudouridine methyltransferase Nep1
MPLSFLTVQLLHDLSISAKGSTQKLLKVIKNPITDHLPPGCKKIGKGSHSVSSPMHSIVFQIKCPL